MRENLCVPARESAVENARVSYYMHTSIGAISDPIKLNNIENWQPEII